MSYTEADVLRMAQQMALEYQEEDGELLDHKGDDYAAVALERRPYCSCLLGKQSVVAVYGSCRGANLSGGQHRRRLAMERRGTHSDRIRARACRNKAVRKNSAVLAWLLAVVVVLLGILLPWSVAAQTGNKLDETK